MTSKISLPELIRNELRQNAWLPALIFVVSFFLYPVYYLLCLADSRSLATASVAERKENFLNAAVRVLGSGNVLTLGAIAVAAVLAACVMFYYLDSRVRSDFFQSLAIKREKLFLARFLSGWLAVVVPYFVALLLALFGIGAVYGNVRAAVLVRIFSATGLFILGFSAVYAFCVLAMVLAGRTLVGILLMVCLLLYGPAFSAILHGIVLLCFPTVGGPYADIGWAAGSWLSPLTVMIQSFGIAGEEISAVSVIVLAAYLAGALLLGCALYRRRPAEAAGNAFSFSGMSRVLKVAVTVPAAVGAGLMIGTWMSSGDRLAVLPSVVFTLLLAFVFNGIMEFIIYVDLRSIRRHWRSLAVTMVFCSGILVFFLADPFRINSWLPEENRISAMAVCVPSSWGDFGSVMPQENGEVREVLNDSFSGEFAPVYEMVQKYEYGSFRSSRENTETVTVAFRMKSGWTHYRTYEIPESEVLSVLESLGEQQDWREGYYPVNRLDPSRYRSVSIENWISGDYPQKGNTLAGSSQIARLAEALREDTDQMSFRAIQEELPLYRVVFEGGSAGGDTADYESYYVFAGFSRTRKVLQEMGIQTDAVEKSGFSPDEIESMDVSGLETDADGDDRYTTWKFTDQEQIEALFSCTKLIKNESWTTQEKSRLDAYLQCQDGDYWVILEITDREQWNTLTKSLKQEDVTYDEES